MSEYTEDGSTTLAEDANFDEVLERVRFEAGMMLGVDATQAEQSYHRRRLTRLQYWLLGFGTLAGLRVQAARDGDVARLLVGSGIAIDGFGREVLVEESYCINLGDWIASRDDTALAEMRDGSHLQFEVTLRHRDCLVSPAPTLARRLNFGTDGVSYSRIKDAPLLELGPIGPAAGAGYRPWANHDSVPELADVTLSAAENTTISGVTDAEARELLRLHARMVHAFESQPLDPDIDQHEAASRARILLAHIRVPVTADTPPRIDSGTIAVNNLVRPFITTAGQLAWLSAQ